MTRPTKDEVLWWKGNMEKFQHQYRIPWRSVLQLCDAYLELQAELQDMTNRNAIGRHLFKTESEKTTVLKAENAALTSILHDYHARMADTYCGAPDANNRMAFNGSDKDELERLLKEA